MGVITAKGMRHERGLRTCEGQPIIKYASLMRKNVCGAAGNMLSVILALMQSRECVNMMPFLMSHFMPEPCPSDP